MSGYFESSKLAHNFYHTVLYDDYDYFYVINGIKQSLNASVILFKFQILQYQKSIIQWFDF